ncbi:MAG: DUF885 domain-containing protein [Acidobacteriota bacterium]
MKTIVACLLIACGLVSNAPAQTTEAEKLNSLFTREWQWTLETSPTFASFLGDKRYNTRWDDQSLDAIAVRNQHAIDTLATLKQIDRTKLSPADRVNYDLFQNNFETSIQYHETRLYLLPISQRGGIQTADELADQISFQTVKDYEDWIARLNAFPVYMDQTLALLREGKASGMLWSKQVLTRIPAQLDKHIVDDAEKSPFYSPFRKLAAEIPDTEAARLRSAAKTAIQNNVVPSFRKLKVYFESEYLPASYPQAGIWQMKGGDKIYEFLARYHTTTDLTPRQIHEKGLSEVARIRAEMERVKTQAGFNGTLHEFFTYLRSDPKFFYKTPDELLNAYRAIAKRIDPETTKVFRTFPRTPYGVIPIPEKIAPDTTTAYYNQPAADGSRPGYFYVNLYKPETRPKWEMMALAIHESVPGHHFQLSLQQEMGEMPNFRKYGGYTAFVEGWGLYSESLGEEMGLYSDPYDKFGQLTYEMWRAIRLVVDTGMHYYKWDRQKAIDYFKDNAAKTDQDIVNEIDRYISDPGQALAYKIGELKIKELRARSRTALGAKFDLKAFHDVVLLTGAVPLGVLEKNVDEWIAKEKAEK